MAKGPALYTDSEMVAGLLDLDPAITSYVFYNRAYPLFKHLFLSYYTDCNTCLDLAHEIYVFIMIPGPKTGKSKLQSFGFKSSFETWLSVVSHNYCYAKYKKRVILESEKEPTRGDSLQIGEESIDIDMKAISHNDIITILSLMPNKRYQQIIRLLYIDGKDNDETANVLGMSKANLYNKHILAKAQFVKIMKREGLV